MHRLTTDVGKVVGAGIVGAAGAVVCVIAFFVLPAIVGLVLEGAFEIFGTVRTALIAISAVFTAWVLQVSAGSLFLAWIMAASIAAAIGGFIGGFLGCLCATVVLRRRLEA